MQTNSGLVACKPIGELPPTANDLPERVKNILLAQPLNPLVKLAFSIVRNGPKAPASQPA